MDSLLKRSFANVRLEEVFGAEVNVGSQNFAEPLIELTESKERNSFRRVVVGEEVDVRTGVGFSAGD
jgi:hypothetical protein